MYYLIIFSSLLASLIVIDDYKSIKIKFLKHLINQVAYYREWLGLLLLFYGLKNGLFLIYNTIANLDYSLYNVLLIYVGFYLSFGFFKRFFGKRFETKKKITKRSYINLNAFVGLILLSISLFRLYKIAKYLFLS